MRSILFALALVSATAATSAQAACAATATHFCVSHTGAAFAIDTGDGSGLVTQRPLTLTVGNTYEFELVVDVSFHPFVLTHSSTGGTSVGILTTGEGVTGPSPATTAGDVVTYVASAPTSFYYQCNFHTGMGAAISVVAAATDAGTDAGVDAGSQVDAGGGEVDAGGAADAGSVADAGAPVDAGADQDAGATVDAGALVDAGTTDAGAASDAGSGVDAGHVADSGVDAGAPVDAGIVCPAGQVRCGSLCVNLTADPAHCGSCTFACGADQTCAASACKCTGTAKLCNGACVNTTSDPYNCGACDHFCGLGLMCSNGACVTGCAAGQTKCGSSCVDMTTDTKNCGGCLNDCARPFQTTTCTAGVCVATKCETGHVDLDKSSSNGCEYACTASGAETCDGLDNDCNGRFDELPSCAPPAPQPTPDTPVGCGCNSADGSLVALLTLGAALRRRRAQRVR